MYEQRPFLPPPPKKTTGCLVPIAVVGGLGVLVLGSGIVCAALKPGADDKRAVPVASRHRAEVNCNELLDRVACQEMVRARLNFPLTADFSGMLLGDQVSCGKDGSNPMYLSHVTSKNAFGVPIETRFFCEVVPLKAPGHGKGLKLTIQK